MRHFILFFAFLLCFSADLFSQPKEAVAIHSGKIVARRISHYLDTPIGRVSVAPLVRSNSGQLLYQITGDVLRDAAGTPVLRKRDYGKRTFYHTAAGAPVAVRNGWKLSFSSGTILQLGTLTDSEIFVITAIFHQFQQ